MLIGLLGYSVSNFVNTELSISSWSCSLHNRVSLLAIGSLAQCLLYHTCYYLPPTEICLLLYLKSQAQRNENRYVRSDSTKSADGIRTIQWQRSQTTSPSTEFSTDSVLLSILKEKHESRLAVDMAGKPADAPSTDTAISTADTKAAGPSEPVQYSVMRFDERVEDKASPVQYSSILFPTNV